MDYLINIFENLKAFYQKNKWFVWLIFIALVFITIGNIYFIACIDNKLAAGKVWEATCCLLTFVYSIMFWLSKEGRTIFQSIKQIFKKFTKIALFFAHGILLLVTIINISLIINFTEKSGILSIGCVSLVFIIFCFIDLSIIYSLNKKSNKRKDFVYALTNSDFPTVLAFIFLFIYSLFIYSGMEIFFSGAISFQMLVSCGV